MGTSGTQKYGRYLWQFHSCPVSHRADPSDGRAAQSVTLNPREGEACIRFGHIACRAVSTCHTRNGEREAGDGRAIIAHGLQAPPSAEASSSPAASRALGKERERERAYGMDTHQTITTTSCINHHYYYYYYYY